MSFSEKEINEKSNVESKTVSSSELERQNEIDVISRNYTVEIFKSVSLFIVTSVAIMACCFLGISNVQQQHNSFNLFSYAIGIWAILVTLIYMFCWFVSKKPSDSIAKI